MTVHDLPPINATLNAASAVLLAVAYVLIKRNRVHLHAYTMITALLCSAAFLVCYLIYHFNVPAKSVGLPKGLFRTGYLTMLATHVVLAVAMLPMIVMTLFRAYRRDWAKHKKIARPTWWIWMYVSVTGVIIYVVLYHLVPYMYPVTTTAGAM
ncbi:hypothetical protein BH09PLA1_BH09PLA1_22320 [soil metagenome]